MLIFNALAKRQGVTLPGIGALYVTVAPATMPQPGIITPPINRVELAPEEQSTLPHIFDLIAQENQIDIEQAQELYYRWLAGVCSENGVAIYAVGSIRDGIFTPDPELAGVLNVIHRDPVKLPNRVEPKRVILWIACGIAAGIIIAFGLISWLEYGSPMPDFSKTNTQQTQAVTADTLPMSTLTPAQPLATDSVAVAASQQEVTTATPSTAAVSTSSGPRYCVIVGTYSTDANAEKFIASAKKINQALTYEKIPQANGRILISVFSSGSEAEAAKQKTQIEGQFEGAWIYKAKS